MPGLFSREKTVPRFTKLPSALALLLWSPLAAGQNNLGELLDAGAKQLSAEAFKQEVVQRVLVGPTPTGGDLEVMYTTNGLISGKGTHTLFTGIALAEISGEWKIDDSGKICTSMRIGGGTGGAVGGVMLPARCQYWLKYSERYFISDSDSDRSARVLRRTLKQ
jgi:hypothetical protein